MPQIHILLVSLEWNFKPKILKALAPVSTLVLLYLLCQCCRDDIIYRLGTSPLTSLYLWWQKRQFANIILPKKTLVLTSSVNIWVQAFYKDLSTKVYFVLKVYLSFVLPRYLLHSALFIMDRLYFVFQEPFFLVNCVRTMNHFRIWNQYSKW